MSYEDRISIATPEGVDLELTLAGVGSRAVARLLDQLIQLAVMIALAILAALGGSGSGGDEGGALAVAGVILFLFLLQFGYDVLFETLGSGRTPGKRWAGLRVVRVDGAPVGFLPSAIRNLLRLIDFLPGVYGVAILAVLISGRNQRLGDLAAGTVVVREKRVVTTTAPVAPPDAWRAASRQDLSTWDVSSITAEELATVRRFLERRVSLTPAARQRLAGELASRLLPKVVGPSGVLEPEAFLEDVVAAKAARA